MNSKWRKTMLWMLNNTHDVMYGVFSKRSDWVRSFKPTVAERTLLVLMMHGEVKFTNRIDEMTKQIHRHYILSRDHAAITDMHRKQKLEADVYIEMYEIESNKRIKF